MFRNFWNHLKPNIANCLFSRYDNYLKNRACFYNRPTPGVTFLLKVWSDRGQTLGLWCAWNRGWMKTETTVLLSDEGQTSRVKLKSRSRSSVWQLEMKHASWLKASSLQLHFKSKRKFKVTFFIQIKTKQTFILTFCNNYIFIELGPICISGSIDSSSLYLIRCSSRLPQSTYAPSNHRPKNCQGAGQNMNTDGDSLASHVTSSVNSCCECTLGHFVPSL